MCLAQPARPAWLPGRCATNVVDAGSPEAQSLCLIGSFSDSKQTEAERFSNLEREANSLVLYYRAQSQRKVKSYAQSRSTPTGMVMTPEEEKDHWARHWPKAPSPATLPEWPAPGEWTPESHHIFHPGITQLWSCCHPRGQVSPSWERPFLGSHYQLKEKGEEEACCDSRRRQRRHGGGGGADKLPFTPGLGIGTPGSRPQVA